MRGTRVSRPLSWASLRIIPAHAGNSRPYGQDRADSADHPRACGELPKRRDIHVSCDGSSPRMRGTPHRRECVGRLRRIIPAHAGNSQLILVSRRIRSDHPRACGELIALMRFLRASAGSSPRMRGTLLQVRPELSRGRIIPAHAGNSVTPSSTHRQFPDHPRACGELVPPGVTLAPKDGSSPRMRGTHMSGVAAVLTSRIIPAHAGNSRYWARFDSAPSDHPRACGELEVRPVHGAACHGSSPRMRGTRYGRAEIGHRNRIIPAHAGNSIRTR